MSLKNIKRYVQAVRQNVGILLTDQLELVTRADDPSDSDLANGRIYYKTGVGFRAYAEGAWFTIPTSTTGGSGSSWDTLYSADKSLTIDGASLTFAGVHATNDVITISNSGTGSTLQLTNTSTGADITGTSATWSVSAAGAAVFTQITGCDVLTAATNLAINATGAGTIAIGDVSSGAVTITPALTAVASITITGTADSNVLTVTAGDILVSNGILSLDSDDTTTGNLVIPSSTATSGNVISVTADDLTSGAAIFVDSDNGASFSGNGGYIHLNDGTNPVFTVKRYGATVIAGNAATNVLTITAGHEVITSGNLTLTSGNLVMTSGSFTYTAGDMTMSDGSLAITDADDAASFSVTNSTATTASVIVIAGAGAFTGSTTTSFMTVTPSGLTTGTGIYEPLAALTQGKGLHITSGASLTTGSLLYVQDTGANCAITSGTAATFDLTATAITGTVNKIGAGVSVTSSRTTTTGTVADDFDLVSIVRTDIINGGGSMSATGSVLYVENAVTNTSGTVTDTTNGVEIVMDTLGTGVGLKVTHAAVGANAISVISAATTVSDVLITGSGVKANNKASLEVTNSGATAAGGSILRVTNTGTPAAATSYLVDFDYSGATMTNNPVAVFIDAGATTAAGLQVTGSGASAGGLVELNSTATGALGAVLKLSHRPSDNSEANSDVIGRILFEGQDDANAAETYGSIDMVIRDVTAAGPDSSMVFYTDKAGTSTQHLAIGWDTVAGATFAGILVGTGAATGLVSSQGAYDLTLETNGGTNSGTITITDGASGAITLTPNGSGAVDLAGKTIMSKTTTSSGAGAVAVTGSIHEITTTGADALTLADGTEGQMLYVVMVVDGGDGTLTPTSLLGYTTITFNSAGDAVLLLFTAAKWTVIANTGCTLA